MPLKRRKECISSAIYVSGCFRILATLRSAPDQIGLGLSEQRDLYCHSANCKDVLLNSVTSLKSSQAQSNSKNSRFAFFLEWLDNNLTSMYVRTAPNLTCVYNNVISKKTWRPYMLPCRPFIPDNNLPCLLFQLCSKHLSIIETGHAPMVTPQHCTRHIVPSSAGFSTSQHDHVQ